MSIGFLKFRFQLQHDFGSVVILQDGLKSGIRSLFLNLLDYCNGCQPGFLIFIRLHTKGLFGYHQSRYISCPINPCYGTRPMSKQLKHFPTLLRAWLSTEHTYSTSPFSLKLNTTSSTAEFTGGAGMLL